MRPATEALTPELLRRIDAYWRAANYLSVGQIYLGDIFAFRAYPWLIHRLTYRRTNHQNIHVRGYKEEGTITTPFDMTVLNDLDRFHLAMDVIDRLPQTGDRGIYLKQQLKDKLVEHRQYIEKHGEDMPEVRNWKWGNLS